MHAIRDRPESAERHGAGHVARCTVEHLMGNLGLRGVRRAKSPRTTRSAPREQCPADLVKRHFEPFAPGELWVADIPPQAGGTPSYVRTLFGWIYVAFVTDVYSRRIIGWQTSTSLYTDPALDALKMAVWQRKRQGADLTGLVHHSDRGVQYRSIRYGQALADCETVASVRSKGDSYRLCPSRGSELLVQGRADPQPGPLGGHRRRPCSPPPSGSTGQAHPTSLRYRYANPSRARSHLGTRPPPPRTITTGNHRHQINQPPQHPGLDNGLGDPAAQGCLASPVQGQAQAAHHQHDAQWLLRAAQAQEAADEDEGAEYLDQAPLGGSPTVDTLPEALYSAS